LIAVNEKSHIRSA